MRVVCEIFDLGLDNMTTDCQTEITLFGDYRDSFNAGNKLKIDGYQILYIVTYISETEMKIKPYSEIIAQQKKATNNQPYYRKYLKKVIK